MLYLYLHDIADEALEDEARLTEEISVVRLLEYNGGCFWGIPLLTDP